MAKAEAVYWGGREAMVAEVSAFDPVAEGITSAKKCKYLVMPYGDAQWDVDWCSSKKDALAIAREMAAALGVPVHSV